MKKNYFLITVILALSIFIFAACGDNSVDPPAKSSDTALTVTSVCGETVTDGSVTLSELQYNELNSEKNKAAKTVYSLADKATLSVSLSGYTLTFSVTAEDGTKEDYQVAVTVKPEVVLSSDTSLNVTKVLDREVKQGSVTMKESEYDEFASAESPISKITYTVADKATVAVTLEDKTIKFLVTAEDGTTKEYFVGIFTEPDYVPSDDASISVSKVYGVDVVKNVATYSVTVPMESIIAIQSEEDILSKLEYEAAEKSFVSAKYDKALHSLTVTCKAEDSITEQSLTIILNAEIPFGKHSRNDYGSASNVSYDYASDQYCIKGNAVVQTGGKNLSENWAFYADVLIPELGEKEFRLVSNSMETAFIRYVLRGHGDGTVELFTDYKDCSDSYRSYIVHMDDVEYSATKKYRLGIINVGNSVVVTYNGKTLNRRTLPTQFAPELLISSDATAYLSNTWVESDAEKVKAAYNEALEGFTDTNFGKTLLGTGTNVEKATQNDDGSITIKSLGVAESSGGRVMGAIRHEGVPISGYRYAVTGRLEITNTKRTGSAASKVELQIAKNTSNYIKLYLFRFPTNNSLYYQCTDNGVLEAASTPIKQKIFADCEATDVYTIDYIYTYDLGKIELWVKEIAAGSSNLKITEWTKLYERNTEWGFTNFCIGNTQYCDVTFRNTTPHYGEDFDKIMESLYQKSDLSVGGAFNEQAFGSYIKESYAYASEPVKLGGAEIKGDHFKFTTGVTMPSFNAWAQTELMVAKDETHAVRYVFEYAKNGNFQVFTEYKNGHSSWQGWRVVLAPSAANPNASRLTVVNNGGTVSLLIGNYLYHTYTDMSLTGAALKVGGKEGSIRLFGLNATTDKAEVEKFASEMKEYSYVSPYENAIRTRETTYENATTGGALFFGSSTMDFWESYATDCGLTDGVNAYNVGIGGTIVEDWVYAYDRLIKPFKPSKVIVFLGGNNVTAKGQTGEETVKKLGELLERIHADFKDAPIYYIYSMPCPGYCVDGVYKGEYGDLVYGMHEYVEKNSSWLTGIDMHDVLTDDKGNALPGTFKSDNIHLTEYGYTLWTSVLKPIVFPEK